MNIQIKHYSSDYDPSVCRNRWLNPLILFIVLIFPVQFMYSQSDSLMNYLEIAAKNNPTVLQRYNEYQAALQKVPQVGGMPDPQLELGVFLSPMELVAGNQVADIKLMQMFPWFGVLKNAKDEMSLMAKGKYELFRDAKLQVFYDVQRTAYELQKNRLQIRFSEKNLEILKTIERLAIVKFRTGGSSSAGGTNKSNVPTQQNNSLGSSGMSTGGKNSNSGSTRTQTAAPMPTSNTMGSSAGGSGLVDLYNIQLETGELENNIALLKSQQTTISARFNTYLNRPLQSAVSLPDTLKTDSIGMAYLSVSDSAIFKNPMLGMLKYEQQSLDARTRMQKQMGLPMVGLGVNYSVITKSEMSTSPMNGQSMIMPMLTVTLPIYRRKYNAMQAETKFLKTASEQNYQATANALQSEYYEARQLYFDAQRRIKLFENQTQLAQQSLNILIKNFSVSGSGLTEILGLGRQVLDYQFKRIEAITDFNTAIAWIKRLKTTPNP